MSCANRKNDFGAVIDTSSANQSLSPPQMFKLNVDCFEHLFEWLSLEQLLTFRRTCKRMKQVVDYYIKLNYPQLLRLSIYNRRRWIDFHSVHLNYFEWIKQLSIDFMPDSLIISVPTIESVAYVLNRLEVLKLNGVRFIGDFHEVILKHCPLVKHLNVTTNNSCDSIIGTGNQWLLRKYPLLEHFEIHAGVRGIDPIQYTTELMAFFKQNPKIRIFSTGSAFLDQIHCPMLESNIKFERLDIYMEHRLSWICNLANILYENEFFKRLHLFNNNCHLIENEEKFLSSFKNLEKLHLYTILDNNEPIPIVESIEELSIGWLASFPMDTLKMMAENFINLRRVDMRYPHMHDIRTFVCHAPKLQQIRFVGLYRNELPAISDFLAMNDERKKLIGARKVKILIDERAFLECKWTAKINFSLIELKRTDMYCVDREYHWL